MGRTLAIGTYLERRTWLHGVEPEAKAIALLLLTIATFGARGSLGLALVAAELVAGIVTCHVSPRTVARAIAPTAVVLVFALLANALVVDGSGDVALAGRLGVSIAGATRGAFAVARIVLLVGLVCLVSSTTTAPQLADGLVRLLTPLGAAGVPVGDVAMVVSLALRLIPETVGEFDRIVLAQRARGVRFDEGGPLRRLGRYASVVIPLTVALFQRSDDLAGAMRDRCYSGRAPERARWGTWSCCLVALAALTMAACLCLA